MSESILLEEVWKDIQGYEGWYQVSNHGRVRSLERTITQESRYGHTVNRLIKGKYMAATDNGKGYKIVGLRMNQNRKNHYLHRLVAEAFIANPDCLPEVNHKDANKANNSINNLEWVDRTENIQQAIPHMRREHKSWRTQTGEKYIQVRNGRYRLNIVGVIDRTYSTMEEALKMRGVVLNDGKHHAV